MTTYTSSERDKPSGPSVPRPQQSPPVHVPLRRDPVAPDTGKGVPRTPSINPPSKK